MRTYKNTTSDSCSINQNQTTFTIFRLFLIETDIRLVQKQSENGKYYRIPEVNISELD